MAEAVRPSLCDEASEVMQVQCRSTGVSGDEEAEAAPAENEVVGPVGVYTGFFISSTICLQSETSLYEMFFCAFLN